MTDPGAPFWVPSGALQRHGNRLASGDPGVDWLSHVRARHLPAELPRTLVVGCGDGFLERALARMPGAGAILAVDADPSAVDTARRKAGRIGLKAVSHARFDPDTDAPPPGPWDAILVHGVLHHAAEPGTLLRRLHGTLAPRGRLVFFEYVGPNRFRLPEERLEIVRRYSRLLPRRLHQDPGDGGDAWKPAHPDPDELARTRPLEAARSEELLELARRTLRREAVLSGGGGLLHPLLSGREANFGRDPAGDERVLAVLCAAEADLATRGLLPDAFAVFIGRRRDGGAG